MYVDFLELTDFRSYHQVEVELSPGVSVFEGQNGQGKTNLVEAIEYLSTLASHRVSQDQPLVRAGADQAVIRAGVRAGVNDERRIQLDLEIQPGKSNRARLNRGVMPKASAILGMLRVVLFSPDDLAVVKGEPKDRRRFLDEMVIGRWPRMAGVKADYERVVRQRNALLKQMSGRTNKVPDENAEFTLQVWDSQLCDFGAELLAARLDSLTEMTPFTKGAYELIAPINNVAQAEYKCSFPLPEESSEKALRSQMADVLIARRGEELARGVTLIGPHRDDVLLSIGELPAKGYASHGEAWSLALSLRLAVFELLRSDGIEPVLLLDDVFAELDAVRRLRLADAITEAEQVLITAAVGTDVPNQLGGKHFVVTKGRVEAKK
uniref:DNA replication/repair protein RecF n=1 Tax=Vaginimicrobium propionicum TaxID=1871034 RepID=UPI0009707AF6|nr:DNA replication/repair protein RecF [Vaginimicrobium propionicum]